MLKRAKIKSSVDFVLLGIDFFLKSFVRSEYFRPRPLRFSFFFFSGENKYLYSAMGT